MTAAVATKPRAKDFSAGRQLAVEMLHEAQALWHTDEAEAIRWYRGGAEQNRFAKKTLERLIAEPRLLDGFSAILSAYLGASDGLDASAYDDLPDAEFEAGKIGADGTRTEEDDNRRHEEDVEVAERHASSAPEAQPLTAEVSAHEHHDPEDLGAELLAINRLVGWVFQARDLMDNIRLSAEIDPAFEAGMRKNDIRYNSADFIGNDVAGSMTYLLMHQHTLIEELGEAAISATKGISP